MPMQMPSSVFCRLSLKRGCLSIVLLGLAGCASAPASNSPPPQPQDALIDKTQRSVDSVVDSTAQWFDNLFGIEDTELDAAAGVTRGRISAGTQWSEYEGTKQRIRLKASLQLPALKRRTRLLFGRADADDIIEGKGDDNIDTLPERFNDFDDEDWLFGVGYSRDRTLARGWDLGVGIKVATPIEQYARANYRWNWSPAEAWLWRLRPQVFWKSDRGEGVSITSTLDHAATSQWLLRSWSIVVVDADTEGAEWDSKLTAYQRLRKRSAMSYSLFASGETGGDVSVRNYGFELRYRRPFAREWLYLELLTNLAWPRETLLEQRESSFGVGFEIEMHFGSVNRE